MRFTPTSKYLTYAKGAAKTITWRVYVKKTTSLSEDLATGTWVEVTDRIEDMPESTSRLEVELGQPTSDSLEFSGRDIAWWKANVFNATASEYVEVKAQFQLGLSGDVASDTVYTFSGFVDKSSRSPSSPTYNEMDDTVTFTAFTAQEIGARIAAEVLTAQYLDSDVDGSATPGMILPKIPPLSVTDAAVTGFELKLGTHTITYDYNSGTPQASLDDGTLTNLSNGATTIVDGDALQKVSLYVTNTNRLPQSTDQITDNVVVVTKGDTIPRQWYINSSRRALLKKCFTQMGITDITWGTDDINVVTGSKVSYLETPPDDGATVGLRWALVSDGTDLWVGVGNKLYYRETATQTYTLKATLTAGHVITKLWYNARNGHIWVLAQTSPTNIAPFVLRHTISGGANTSEVALATSASKYSIELCDINYVGGSYKYSIIYTDPTNNSIREVLSSTMTDALLFSRATLGYTGADGPDGNFSFVRNVSFYAQSSDTSNSYLHEIQVDVTGVWMDLGIFLTLTAAYQIGAYHVSEDRIYFLDVVNFQIKSHLRTTATETVVLTVDTVDSSYFAAMMYLNTAVYFTTVKFGYLYSVASNTATQLYAGSPRLFTKYFAFAYIDRLYGLDEGGLLYQYHTSAKLYVPLADFSGQKVIDAFNSLLSPVYVGNISSHKKGYVYLRSTPAGAHYTTGNILSLTVSEAGDITESTGFAPPVGFIEVSNTTDRSTYDGTDFNSAVLSDVKSISVNSQYLPSNLLDEIAYHLWQFFSAGHDMYRFPLEMVPLFQFEPLDGCTIAFTGTKIVKSATDKPIYATVLKPDGSMEVEVLI